VCFELQKESSSGQTDELSSCIQGCMLMWIGNLNFFFLFYREQAKIVVDHGYV
jgi:hypothetical protein